MSRTSSMKPVFFATPDALRSWLEKNHAQCAELWVGFYKRGSGKPSVTWPEVVDEALCFGWIDGVRKSLDDDSYTIRLTPRRPQSTWSTVNIRRATDLARRGLMSPAGRRAFEQRTEKRSGIYSYEQRHNAKFSSSFVKTFRAHTGAWAFFRSQPPWYQQTATFWVVSAKKEDTKVRRLALLIAECGAGRIIGPLKRPTPARGLSSRRTAADK
jgi:uncharacterized protein YdeI (YjbR/CyaY-like superfamily)